MSAVEYPADAICAVDHCGHPFSSHRLGSNCDVCENCERHDGVFERKAWHDFKPTRLAAGAFTATAEQEAYKRALRGEA